MTTIWKTIGDSACLGKERGESLWFQPELKEKKQPLIGEIHTEIAIIGGGLAGLLSAYLLSQEGRNVIVLEKGEVGCGITKNTTAKITSSHGLIYHKLIQYKGEERGREYGTANQLAISMYEKICNDLSLDCDFERLPNYIYTLDNEASIEKEWKATRRLGLPASIKTETPLPFPIKAALCFEEQAQFHPIKFLKGIEKELTIYENCKVTEVKKDGTILTEEGKIHAEHIIITTHFPFINRPGYYFLRLHQDRSYLMAFDCKESRHDLQGMYLDADPNGYTFRNYKNYLIIGGGGHRAGKYNPLNAYHEIEESARKWYPELKTAYKWSNQDCMTPDGIPYIGTYSASTPNIYVATGFNKWGMTSSMVSAIILKDIICFGKSEYQKVFHPRRMMFSGSGTILKDTGIITVSLLKEHLKIPRDKLDNIKQNQSGIVIHKGQRVGIYRDFNDDYHMVSTKCPHLGCSLEWNQNELTWDCPCHGSRFDYRGNIISNPATRGTLDKCQLTFGDGVKRV